MQSLHTTAHFEADGSVTLKAPGLASPGEHRVLIVLEDHVSPATDAMMASEGSFAKVWDNSDDEIYDTL